MIKKLLFIFAFLAYSVNAQEGFNIKVSISPRDEVGEKKVFLQESVEFEEGKIAIISILRKGIEFSILENNRVTFREVTEFQGEELVVYNWTSEKPLMTTFYNDEFKIFTTDYQKTFSYAFNAKLKTITRNNGVPIKYTKEDLELLENVEASSERFSFHKALRKSNISSTDLNKHNATLNKDRPDFLVSPNKRQFAEISFSKNKNTYNVKVINVNTSKEIYRKEIYKKVEKKIIQAVDGKMDNQGNVYVLLKEYFRGKEERRDKKANYKYLLVKVSKDGVKQTEILVKEGLFIGKLRLFVNDDSIELTGFYSEGKKDLGIAKFDINTASLEIENSNYIKFTEDVFKSVAKGTKVKVSKNKKVTIDDYYIDYLFKDADKNTYIVAEYTTLSFKKTQTKLNQMSTSNLEELKKSDRIHGQNSFKDLLIYKLNPKGVIEWVRTIRKRDNKPSYKVYFLEDALNIIYQKKSSIMISHFSKDGTVKEQEIFKDKDANFDINASTITNNKVVLYDTYSKRKRQYIVIEIY